MLLQIAEDPTTSGNDGSEAADRPRLAFGADNLAPAGRDAADLRIPCPCAKRGLRELHPIPPSASASSERMVAARFSRREWKNLLKLSSARKLHRYRTGDPAASSRSFRRAKWAKAYSFVPPVAPSL